MTQLTAWRAGQLDENLLIAQRKSTMQDLYHIKKANSEAAQRELAKAPKGKYSVAEFSGLHFVKYHYSDDYDVAVAIAAAINARRDSSRAELQKPHPIAVGADAAALA